jgi:hypothetical protein
MEAVRFEPTPVGVEPSIWCSELRTSPRNTGPWQSSNANSSIAHAIALARGGDLAPRTKIVPRSSEADLRLDFSGLKRDPALTQKCRIAETSQHSDPAGRQVVPAA